MTYIVSDNSNNITGVSSNWNLCPMCGMCYDSAMSGHICVPPQQAGPYIIPATPLPGTWPLGNWTSSQIFLSPDVSGFRTLRDRLRCKKCRHEEEKPAMTFCANCSSCGAEHLHVICGHCQYVEICLPADYEDKEEAELDNQTGGL